MASLKLVSVLIAFMVVAQTITVQGGITCGTVASALRPCVPYLTGSGPLGTCCGGVRSLNAAAKTTADRQAACNCLKQAAGGYPGIKPNLASGLPGVCKVNIPYKISTSTNCATVK
uniref:Non-specific lipid-transfer protein n=1 Tax=Rhizophora mucronata TaxID=61149 RepID=A0A2P2IXW2_RHIMU